MTHHSSPASPRDAMAHRCRALIVLAGALGATLVLLGAGMPGARAHDELVATTPAHDTTAPTPPATVTLQFSRAVQALGTQVLVSGPDGAPVSQGAVEVRDAAVVQPLAADGPAGAYRVSWRVTSSDRHLLSGEFAFTVAEGARAAGPGPSAPRVEEPAGRGKDDAEVSETAAQQPLHFSPSYGLIALGGVLPAVAGGLVLLRRRRRT